MHESFNDEDELGLGDSNGQEYGIRNNQKVHLGYLDEDEINDRHSQE